MAYPQDGLFKQQAKSIFKNLSKGHNEASRMSLETGPLVFHYIIEGRVCYLTLCDRSYPKKLAFQYLEDLKNEFERVNGSQIETAARPYAFIKFDTFIQKTKKLYSDTRTQRNIGKLNDELYEVQQIMTKNVQEVLGVGEKLDRFDSKMGSGCHCDWSCFPSLLDQRENLVISVYSYWICTFNPFGFLECGRIWVLGTMKNDKNQNSAS